MVSQAVAEKQRGLTIAEMQRRMPHTIFIRDDPLFDETQLPDDTVSDAAAIYEVIWDGANRDEVTQYACQISRQSLPYTQGGFTPADDVTDRWDVIIPGGVLDTIKASDVVVVLPRDDSAQRVYTIVSIAQDHLEYIARLTMEEYGSRRA